jgi:hypothetical protein
MTRSLQRYQKDIGLGGNNFLRKYVPVLTKAFQKKNEQNDDAENTDQLGSFFFSWVMPKSGWEFYGEWGYNDYKQNIRDLTMDATHSSAYILGIQKMFKKNKHIFCFGIETLKQSETPSSLLRYAGNWYIHGRDNGYTNGNQIIGAGAGFGSNLQTIRIQYQNQDNSNKILFQFEKINHDPLNFNFQWTDFYYLLEPSFKAKKMFVVFPINFVHARNFAWSDKKIINIQARIKVIYKIGMY